MVHKPPPPSPYTTKKYFTFSNSFTLKKMTDYKNTEVKDTSRLVFRPLWSC